MSILPPKEERYTWKEIGKKALTNIAVTLVYLASGVIIWMCMTGKFHAS